MSYKKLKDTWIINEKNYDYSDNLLKELKLDNLVDLEYLYQQALKITNSKEEIEGNLYSDQHSYKLDNTKLKKMASIVLNPNIKSYLEVGVNAGHSLLNILQNSNSINKVLLLILIIINMWNQQLNIW